ncbi:MAG: PilT/PilU family type 4a pilus ATPase [Coriobacteriia bacterium]
MGESRILIVHDDMGLVETLKNAIEQALPGSEVASAISAPRALGLCMSTPPDLVIVDGDLTGMDGYTFTKQLLEEEGCSGVKVIILAESPTEASALKARQSGAAAHLSQAADTTTVVEKVASLLSVAAETPQAPVETPLPEPVGGYGVAGPPSGVPVGAVQVGSAVPGGDAPVVDDLLREMVDRGGSDLHIAVGSAPGFRIRGELIPVDGAKTLTPRDTQDMILNLLSEEQRRRFETELELDFAYSIPGLSRFRANVYQQRDTMAAVFRVVPIAVPTLEELGLPKVCKFLADRPRGLVLVTGPTGAGKSTTLAAMIDHINATRPLHIVTLEDPIEFMHKNQKAYVSQREIGEDTHSFAGALRRVLRQDPDVILVGEMRDLETISAAITAAETGHLVLATLHTTGGPATVDRIIDVFPPHQQMQVRMQLAGTLEGVLSQVLLRSTDGRSRVLAMEIMLGVPAISNLIREGKTHQMPTIIQGGAALGMQTLDQHLKTLLQAGKVTYEEAISKAQNPRELAAMVGRKI